ncbi:MAG: SH3 domain-containing protein [Spirochaetaceae bacterium]|nr:SH3 domain-containing protein [Spirochaetaceae bacterium]
MKERKFVLCWVLVFAVFLLPGCAKKTPVDVGVSAEVVEVEEEVAVDFGYTMRIGMWLYEITGDTGSEADVTKAVEALTLGEKLRLVTAERRKATNSYDNAVYDYYHVRRDTGSEGFVFANQLTVNSNLAVVTDEKANLYRSPVNIDVSDYILPRKTVFGALPETEKDGFIRIEAYDSERGTYRRNLYIRTSAISYRDADVKSSILLQSAEALNPEREANRYEALLNAAFQDYPDSVFADEILAMSSGDSSVPASAIDAMFRVTDDNVNVREKPDASSRVVTQLANNTEVKAIEATVDTYNVNGQISQWFHISQPVDGWIFGAWLANLVTNGEDAD